MEWIKAHAPTNTTAVYATYAKQYLLFTEKEVLNPHDPVSVASFMRDCVERPKPLSRSTVTKVIPSAIADLYRYDTFSPTRDPLVKQAKKVCVSLTTPSKPKLPVTPAMLVQMAKRATPNEISIRDVFMFIIMFVGFLREEEVTSLKVEDMWIGKLAGVEEEVLFVCVAKSKTDPGRNGAIMVLAACPGSFICPVKWYRLYCKVRRSTTHVFHCADKEASKMAKSTPNGLLKKALTGLGIDPKPYGSHSLRRGGATAAAAYQVRTHVLKRHGRWASDAVYLYIQDPGETRVAVSRAILHGSK
jgi:integrase